MSDTRDDQINYDSSTSTFTSALWFNAVLAIGFFSVFSILRTTRPQTYAPRTYAIEKERRPPPLQKGYLLWMYQMLRIDDQTIINSIGLDRFMVLKFLRMGLFVFSAFALISIPILFPINMLEQDHLNGLNYLTMGNVIDVNRTWAHCLLAIILFLSVIWYTFRETKNYIEMRRKYLLSPAYANTVAARTLYVPSIPKEVNNAEELERIFSKYPGGVRRIWLNRHLDDLPELVDKRTKAVLSLETTITKAILATYKHLHKKGNEVEEGLPKSEIPEKIRPTHRETSLPIPLPCVGHKVDSIQFYMNQIKELNESVNEKQKDTSSMKQFNSAFIEFNQQIAAHMAAQCLVHKTSMQMAPRYIHISPSDVIWENLNIRSFERLIRRFISISATTAIIVFWAIPVVFVQVIANLQKLSEVIPFLSVINNLGPTVVGIIQGILPAVALAILISLVPIIFGILSKNEGIPQKSFVQLSVLHKFFFFQFFDVVLVSTISGGIANILSLVKNPLDIITTLSANLPQASTFFITFVMLQATNQAGQSMAQVVPYLLSYLSPIFATTPRQLVGQKRTCPTVNLGTLIPGHTVIFVLGLEYAVIAPLIIPFIILFYAFNYFVYLYQFLYVYELEFETAGRAFPRAIRHVYVGLFTSELTLVGLFAIRKGATGQLVLMIITLVLTVFSLAYYDKAFKPLFKYLPISRFGEDEETQPLLEDSHEDQDKRAKINSLSSDDSDSFPVVFAGHKESRDELVKDINDEDPENNHQENHSKDHLKARVPVIKKATNSSESSPTPVEAYHARNALLNRLLALEQKDDRQLNDEERDRLLRTAKSLYATEAYMHPSSFAPYPTVWIPDDDLGIAQQLIKKMRDSDIDGSSRSAAIVRNEKGKSYVTIDEERLIHEFGGIPGAPPTAVREGNVENYIRVLVDSLNFAGAITI